MNNFSEAGICLGWQQLPLLSISDAPPVVSEGKYECQGYQN